MPIRYKILTEFKFTLLNIVKPSLNGEDPLAVHTAMIEIASTVGSSVELEEIGRAVRPSKPEPISSVDVQVMQIREMGICHVYYYLLSFFSTQAPVNH